MNAADEQDIPESIHEPAEKMGGGKSINKVKRLELLLLDNSDDRDSVEHLVDREVAVVGEGKKNLFSSLFLLVLFCTLLLGLGYYFFSSPLLLQSPPEKQENYYISPRLPVPSRPEIVVPDDVDAIVEDVSFLKPVTSVAASPVVKSKNPLFTVTVGPFISRADLQQAISQLQELGFQPQKKTGRGQVAMIRLLEGEYPETEARLHLEKLKKVVKSAFLLPEGDNLAVYAGSFHQEDRARQMQADLAQKMINVSLVDSIVTMKGTMLAAIQADQQTAREVAAHISSLGLHTRLIKEK
ncbi:MAG: SPOR domain-containing protein [Desulfuromusa sp.]|nr:SPOR domain-containing protein [Desulfuromusa sp.]